MYLNLLFSGMDLDFIYMANRTVVIPLFQKLKLKYYNLMIQLDQHEGSYLSICKHYRAIYDTPCIQAESEKWQQVKTTTKGSRHSKQNVCISTWQIPVHPCHYQTNLQ